MDDEMSDVAESSRRVDNRGQLQQHQHQTLPRAVPSCRHSSSGALDQPIKRKRFQAFDRIVHKIFRRKSKQKFDLDNDDYRRGGKSRSTSELAAVECRSPSTDSSSDSARGRIKSKTIAMPGSRQGNGATIVSGTASSMGMSMMGTTPGPGAGLLSLSHDSVFAPEDEDVVDDEDSVDHERTSTGSNTRKLLHFSRRRFSVKGMKEELMNKLRARRDNQRAAEEEEEDDDDEDDPGLPHSPCSVNTSPTTAELLGQGLIDERARAKKGSKLRSSDNSLLSMGSSETDNEMDVASGVGLKLMFFDRRPNADPELDLGPTILLNHRAAHHRIAIKPRRTHAVPKHRRLRQMTAAICSGGGGGTTLPMTPEEELSASAQSSPCGSGDGRSNSTDQFGPGQSKGRFQYDAETITEVACKSDQPAVVVGFNSNKSHAAECKLKHEIARYEQRMSGSMSALSADGMDVEEHSEDPTQRGEDVEVVATSCFGFGLGRTRKATTTTTAVSTSIVKDAKKPSAETLLPNVAESKKISQALGAKGGIKVFGSRLSGRMKKRSDECPTTTTRRTTTIDWNPPNNKIQTWTTQEPPQVTPVSSFLQRPTDKDDASTEELVPRQRFEKIDNAPYEVEQMLRRHRPPFYWDDSRLDRDNNDLRFQDAASSSVLLNNNSPTMESQPTANLWASLEAKRKSVQHQLTKEDIDELESFLTCSRRSLTTRVSLSSSSDAAISDTSRRPARLSLGSTKDIVDVDVQRITPMVDIEQPLKSFSRIPPADDLSNNNRPFSSVVRLDVAWTDKVRAGVQCDDDNNTSLPLFDQKQQQQQQHQSEVMDQPASINVAAVGPLRRQKSSKGATSATEVEPPELFKVFHRRSLKLKDSDIPVVTQRPSISSSADGDVRSSSLVSIVDKDGEPKIQQQQQQQSFDEVVDSSSGTRRCTAVDQNDNDCEIGFKQVDLLESPTVQLTSKGCPRGDADDSRGPVAAAAAAASSTTILKIESAGDNMSASQIRRKAPSTGGDDDDDIVGHSKMSAAILEDDQNCPPAVQANSTSARSSKVLDLVRNFQKLQAT